MQSRTWHTRTEEETIALGRELAPQLSGAVLLIGNLGAGKTTLAKGIVEGRHASTADEVSSPTFTLIHQYGDLARLFHIDLHRLDEPRQWKALTTEFSSSDSLVLLEWAERFPALLPRDRIEIRLRALADESREIILDKVSPCPQQN